MTPTQQKEEVAARAHRNSLELSPRDLVVALTSKIGAKLVAYIAHKDQSTISRWAKGAAASEDSLRTLRVTYQVFDLLESEEADHTIRAWIIGMNPQLDDLSPAEALRAGSLREVLAAARAFHSGG